jgi:hypothetical protein
LGDLGSGEPTTTTPPELLKETRNAKLSHGDARAVEGRLAGLYESDSCHLTATETQLLDGWLHALSGKRNGACFEFADYSFCAGENLFDHPDGGRLR